MSATPDVNVDTLSQAVDARVRARIDGEVNSLQRTIKIKAILCIVIVLYMSWAMNRISQIDAEFVISTVRYNIRDGQEAFVQSATDELKRSAPTMVRGLRADLLGSVPGLRIDAQRALLGAVDPVAKEIESAMSQDVAHMIELYKLKVEAANPNLSDTDKLRRIVALLRQDFRAEVSRIARSRSSEFSADIQKLNKQIQRLRVGKNLTPKEKYERDLLATWHKLAQMKIKKGEIVPQP